AWRPGASPSPTLPVSRMSRASVGPHGPDDEAGIRPKERSMDEAVEARTAVAVETSDDGGATGLMRRYVRVVVESALANVLGSADTRHAVRAAAETFGDALAAHASAGARSHAR